MGNILRKYYFYNKDHIPNGEIYFKELTRFVSSLDIMVRSKDELLSLIEHKVNEINIKLKNINPDIPKVYVIAPMINLCDNILIM